MTTVEVSTQCSLRPAGRAGFEERGFGVPLFTVDGECFWGNDRLELCSMR